MSTDSDFTTVFPPWNSGAKASEDPVCWLIIAGHLEGTFDSHDTAESDPLLLRVLGTAQGMDETMSTLHNMGIKQFVLAALK
jgi:hypothetical protein